MPHRVRMHDNEVSCQPFSPQPPRSEREDIGIVLCSGWYDNDEGDVYHYGVGDVPLQCGAEPPWHGQCNTRRGHAHLTQLTHVGSFHQKSRTASFTTFYFLSQLRNHVSLPSPSAIKGEAGYASGEGLLASLEHH